MTLKIAIVGAGPAGCVLARLLQQSDEDILVTIFEGEGDIDFRSQGGTLDLHEKTGQAALKAADLFDEFLKYARYDGEAMIICDKNFLCYIKENASSKKDKSITGRPEIDRPKLREMLYNSLAKDTVKWNHKLVNVGEDLKMHFTNGAVESGFDLIIGADGAWSKVRPRLSQEKPFYSGIAGFSFRIPDAEKTQPELYKQVNRGSLFSASDKKSIMAQQMGDGSLNISTWAARDEDWQRTCGYDVHDAKAAKAACKKDYADWDPRLVAFTQEAEDHIIARDLYMLPIGHRWDHIPGVTLVGDASHVMTPFAGEGVNLAFSDSLELSKAIVSAAKTKGDAAAALDKKVVAFEQDMFSRAKATQQLTYDMMTAFFAPDFPRNGIEKYILRAVVDTFGQVVTKVVATPVVYAYFWVFKRMH